jgi:hypothetical protein
LGGRGTIFSFTLPLVSKNGVKEGRRWISANEWRN